MLLGYARVSTAEQTTAPQIEALKRAGCERVFDEQMSGVDADRPELKKALAFAREGDTFVVWKLDRLGRSMKHLVQTVEALSKEGVAFKSLTEGIDTTTAGGTLIFHVFGALAQFERSLIRERTMAGLTNARRLGRCGGRPAANFDIAAAKVMLTVASAKETATHFGVSVSTMYRKIAEADQAQRGPIE